MGREFEIKEKPLNNISWTSKSVIKEQMCIIVISIYKGDIS